MPLLKQSKPSSLISQGETADMTATVLHERLQELEIQNSHLQALVVELLDKNERLRLMLKRPQ